VGTRQQNGTVHLSLCSLYPGAVFLLRLVSPTAAARPPLATSRARALPLVASLRRFLATTASPAGGKHTFDFVAQRAVDYFPYGKSDFQAIRNAGRFFVDNTAAVRELAKLDHAILLRPPRFGKSLLLSTMRAYYDYKSAGDFAALFKGLKAAEGDDPLRSSFHVLHIDLSLSVNQKSTLEDLETRLNENINAAIRDSVQTYALAVDINETNSAISLKNFVRAVRATPCPRLLVLVDEYDRYSNKLMFENPETYLKFVSGTSGVASSSPIRSFFETLKSLDSAGLEQYRTFTTGIAPLALADASGANHMENVTFGRQFADSFGFTERNIVQALHDIGQTNKEAQSHVIRRMRTYYNGYRFAASVEPVYNSTLCLFFLKQ